MNTRNVVHLNERASLRAQAERPAGSLWKETTRPAAQARSAWPGAAWTKARSIPAFREETHEDEDPSLWHD